MTPYRATPAIKDEAAFFMELPPHERAKLTPQRCAEACLVLAQWAAHIDRTRQREEAAADLAYQRLRQLIGHRLNDIRAFSHDERVDVALRECPEAREVNVELVSARAKAKLLSYFSQRVETVCESYRTYANVLKRDRQYGD